ncbi:hypothetical protein GF420_08995, partial [candidate division GN15 bacterium]|nr:hypothetical protein [candidate division GN15 bacterium]
MPAQPSPPAIKLELLYTNIGRGHPFYLDGILEALIRSGQIRLIRRETDVFTVSRGLSRRAWQFARWLYRSGSSGGMSGQLYRFFRRGADYNRPGLGLRLMGRDIKRRYALSADPVLVAHPTLVGILAGRENLLYQHGELVAPEESIVNGAATVFVPTEEVALRFVSSGYARERVVVSGLCIEPALVRQAADSYRARGERLVGDGPLTGAWFSSGAEPKQHLAAIIPAARSVLNKGHRAIIFAQVGGQLAWLVERQLAPGFGLQVSSASNPVTDESSSLTLVLHENRREENG